MIFTHSKSKVVCLFPWHAGSPLYRVRVLANEEPVEVSHPLCSDSRGGCPLSNLSDILYHMTGGAFSLPCQLEDFC